MQGKIPLKPFYTFRNGIPGPAYVFSVKAMIYHRADAIRVPVEPVLPDITVGYFRSGCLCEYKYLRYNTEK